MKILLFALGLSNVALAHPSNLENFTTKPIYADLRDLRALEIPVLAAEETSRVGFAVVTPEMQLRIQERAHQVGKCGGFESLPEAPALVPYAETLQSLKRQTEKDQFYLKAPFQLVSVAASPAITAALGELSSSRLQADVQWLSSFPNRYDKGTSPNVAVLELKARIEQILQNAKMPYQVTLIDHKQTEQKSIRVHLEGSKNPQEIVVLGAHLDSINQAWWGNDEAPGADDNASGSSNLLDILRVVSQKTQPQRSLEFFWYAGEESGLLGSSEIAQAYKSANKTVVAVLQLDMTLFPGAGEMVLGSMTDFTSPWLRDYLKAANETYLHIQIVEDECGYGCSDHASWYRQGYPTLMPFEATMRTINSRMHSADDRVTPEMSFGHSMIYSKIGLIMAMDLANSNEKQPY